MDDLATNSAPLFLLGWPLVRHFGTKISKSTFYKMSSKWTPIKNPKAPKVVKMGSHCSPDQSKPKLFQMGGFPLRYIYSLYTGVVRVFQNPCSACLTEGTQKLNKRSPYLSTISVLREPYAPIQLNGVAIVGGSQRSPRSSGMQ